MGNAISVENKVKEENNSGAIVVWWLWGVLDRLQILKLLGRC